MLAHSCSRCVFRPTVKVFVAAVFLLFSKEDPRLVVVIFFSCCGGSPTAVLLVWLLPADRHWWQIYQSDCTMPISVSSYVCIEAKGCHCYHHVCSFQSSVEEAIVVVMVAAWSLLLLGVAPHCYHHREEALPRIPHSTLVVVPSLVVVLRFYFEMAV